MNRVFHFFAFCLFSFIFFCADNIRALEAPITQSTLIPFSYTNEDLTNIINYIVGLLNKNVFLPQGSNAINVKLSYHANQEFTPQEAWDLVMSFLDLAGYSVIEKDGTYHILKSNKEIAREGLPVYIGSSISTVPDTDQRVMYVHYFTNMHVSNEGVSEIQEILKSILPEDAKYVSDPSKNALIIAAKAHDILNLLDIIEKLDKTEYKEHIDFIKLRYASARVVADLFNEYLLIPEDPAAKFRLDTRKRESNYFAPHTRIIAYDRTNSLIIIGNQQGLARIKEFITNHMDVAPESGNSILHVKRLQYLDAEEFAPVLQKIVESSPTTTGQARTEGKRPAGPERFFDEVIISVDKPKNAQDLKYYGGNNLIIACRNDDWHIIEDLIESLDLPQDQVFIEILIADLTVHDQRLLGTIMRNPDFLPIVNDTAFQSAQLDPGIILSDLPVNPTTNVNSDLLSVPPVATPQKSLASPNIGSVVPGTTAISFNDSNGKTWTIAQILDLFSTSKILSHPHIVATHNKESQFITGQYRLVRGDVTGSIGSNTVVKLEPITADLKIYVTPRISGDQTVNLDIKIDIEEFLPGTSNAKNTRSVKTNANVSSESILTLGGLIRTQTTQDKSQTPLLGDIPILGWFFKSRAGDLNKNNLTVFISPTIVHARLRKGIGTYTQDYITLAEQYSKESVLFDTIKDPITRLFFYPTKDTYAHELKIFMEGDEFISQETIVPVPLQEEERDTTTSETHKEKEDELEGQELPDTVQLSQADQKPIAKARRIRRKKREHSDAPLITVKQEEYEKLKELLPEESPFAAS
ncbi:MAG TPA: hypothetical protein VGW78_04240 [Candidatus Babeliales bacterium]|jgi:general secretion pathway protein D|nr:hypothetical protein [Candidatus Babeliales bacterium]